MRATWPDHVFCTSLHHCDASVVALVWDATLAGAPILLLDEPASNLDALNEHALRRAIEVAAESRTMLVVAHRLATVADADQIVVLDRGAGRRHRPPPRTHRLQPPLPRTCCPSTPDKLTAAANVALARLLVKLGGTRHRCALVTASMREEGCRCLGL
jgi:energy-coupling factor transporter ATP-binding protein EcfA2